MGTPAKLLFGYGRLRDVVRRVDRGVAALHLAEVNEEEVILYSSIVFRSIACPRIRLHQNLIVSFMYNSAMQIVWGRVASDPYLLDRNPVSIYNIVACIILTRLLLSDMVSVGQRCHA